VKKSGLSGFNAFPVLPQRNMGIYRGVFIGIALTIVCTSSQAAIITVDYDNLGDFTTSALDQDGVTVTGSADLKVINTKGLGIVGGNDTRVDTNEFIVFSFNGGIANDVTYVNQVAGNTDSDMDSGERVLEVFDTSGFLLDTSTQVGTGIFDLTALVGDVAISRFTLTSPGSDSFRVSSLSYSVVPIPAAAWLFGSGLLGLIGISRRKRSA
jgi:hypothetical protein